jgi:hypothetical protein
MPVCEIEWASGEFSEAYSHSLLVHVATAALP